jgi:hypothetical protein
VFVDVTVMSVTTPLKLLLAEKHCLFISAYKYQRISKSSIKAWLPELRFVFCLFYSESVSPAITVGSRKDWTDG